MIRTQLSQNFSSIQLYVDSNSDSICIGQYAIVYHDLAFYVFGGTTSSSSLATIARPGVVLVFLLAECLGFSDPSS